MMPDLCYNQAGDAALRHSINGSDPVASLGARQLHERFLTKDRPMWCLVYLETAIFSSVSRLLKTNGFEVHVASDVDDLLDQLWYHGSDVACIILEAHQLTGLDDFTDAIQDWPDIPVLTYGSIVKSIDPSIRNIHCGESYSIERLSHDIFVFDRRHAATNC